MHFSSNNTIDVMEATKLDGVLGEVSRAIAKATIQRNRKNLRPKVQTYDCNEEQTPIYTNYWLAQTDPGFVDQEEAITTINEHRPKGAPKPAVGVKDYLGNWMSPDDLKKALQDRFPVGLTERSLYGGALHSMGPAAEFSFSKIGVGMDFHYTDASKQSRKRMERAIRKHWEKQIV